ncbi:MAG: hypothetical protein IPJ79_10955 [Bacteroidetes bacterium]|nr:hypothetical protein [Bacteroidota bacterium]
MKLNIKYAVAVLMMLAGSNGFSQAIRFNTYNYCDDFRVNKSTDIYDEGGSSLDDNSDFYWGIGYEQNVGDRISVSAEINSSLGKIYSESYVSIPEPYVDLTTGQTYTTTKSYNLYVSYVELKYISKYFLKKTMTEADTLPLLLGLKKLITDTLTKKVVKEIYH